MKLHITTETKKIDSLYKLYCHAITNISCTLEDAESLQTVLFANFEDRGLIDINYMYKKYLTLPYNYIMFDRYSTFKNKELVFCCNYHTFIKFTLLGKHLETSKKLSTYDDFESPEDFEKNIMTWCAMRNIEINMCWGFT